MAIKRTKAYPLDSRQKVVRLARSGLLPKILQLDLDSGRPAILRSATAMSATPTFASFVCSGLTPGISRNARMIGACRRRGNHGLSVSCKMLVCESDCHAALADSRSDTFHR